MGLPELKVIFKVIKLITNYFLLRTYLSSCGRYSASSTARLGMMKTIPRTVGTFRLGMMRPLRTMLFRPSKQLIGRPLPFR